MASPRPKLLRFEFWPGSPEPFLSEWPEMPREVFRSRWAAKAAAQEFVERWSAGGYLAPTDAWWAREDIGETHRLTKFVIVEF